MEGRIRRYFPGGNTPSGYVSLFDQAISWNKFQRIFIIKGGPGVGKSTMMRYMAKDLVKKGINIEILHCTADSLSLDGVLLSDYNIGIIDGTPPHMIDPKVPGCIDEIVNLGQCWNEDGLKQNKDQIILQQKLISNYYKRAYSYLKAAKILRDDLRNIYVDAVDYSITNHKCDELIKNVFDGVIRKEKTSSQRHMFASAITPEGSVNFLECLFEDLEKRFIITGQLGTGKSILIGRVLDAALMKGLDVEVYHCAMNPEKVEHIIIKDLNIGFITSIKPHEFIKLKERDFIINLDEALDTSKLVHYNEIIEYNTSVYWDLYKAAIHNLDQTKKVRFELEKLYYTNMNFNSTEVIRDELLSKMYKIM